MRDDIEEFWASTLAASRERSFPARFRRVESPVTAFAFYDVEFAGFMGDVVRGWLILPGTDEPAPLVVEYLGLGGGRGLPHDHLFWASCGFAHFLMDSRGQGSGWRAGDTPDPWPCGVGGDRFFTRGLQSADEYYYRRFFTDAVLAVDAARQAPGVDASRVAVAGISQGGGTALVVASLRDDIDAVVANVPAFGRFPLAVSLAEEGPYWELANFLGIQRAMTGQAFKTLEFFDTANLMENAKAPALISIGARDVLVPPQSIREAIEFYGGPIDVVEYPFNGHEGGSSVHQLLEVDWVRRNLAEGRDDENR